MLWCKPTSRKSDTRKRKCTYARRDRKAMFEEAKTKLYCVSSPKSEIFCGFNLSFLVLAGALEVK